MVCSPSPKASMKQISHRCLPRGRDSSQAEPLGGGVDEPAGDRRFRRAVALRGHRLADGLERGGVAAGGDARDHPREDPLGQQIR